MNVKDWLAAHQVALAQFNELELQHVEFTLPSLARVRFKIFVVETSAIRVELALAQGAARPLLDARLDIKVTDRHCAKLLSFSELTVADLRRLAELREKFDSWLVGKTDELPTGDVS